MFTDSEGLIRLVIGGINIAELGHEVCNEYLIIGEAEIKYQLKGNGEVVLSKAYDDLWYY